MSKPNKPFWERFLSILTISAISQLIQGMIVHIKKYNIYIYYTINFKKALMYNIYMYILYSVHIVLLLPMKKSTDVRISFVMNSLEINENKSELKNNTNANANNTNEYILRNK